MSVTFYVLLAVALFGFSVYGLLASRNLLKIFLFLETMASAVNIALAAFASYRPAEAPTGQVFVIVVWLVSIANAVVFISLLAYLGKKYKTTDIGDLRELRE